jgi:hypothetical protein
VRLFSEEALELIHGFSEGVPRVINAACDRCLLAEYAKRNAEVTADTARAVLREFGRLTKPTVVSPKGMRRTTMLAAS